MAVRITETYKTDEEMTARGKAMYAAGWHVVKCEKTDDGYKVTYER